MKSELFDPEITDALASTGRLSLRPSRSKKIVLTQASSDNLRTVLRRTRHDSKLSSRYLNISNRPGPGCKLLGVPRHLSHTVTADRDFVRRLIMVCYVRAYAALPVAERNVVNARRAVFRASEHSFLNRVLRPAGYVISSESRRIHFLRGGEWVSLHQGIHRLCATTTSWFLLNAEVLNGERLLELLMMIEDA